jgi:hypothetical protein
MVFVLHLFWYRKTYAPTLRTREGHAVIGFVTALCIFLGVYAIRHLPFIDFRAYRIGNNIPAQMKPEEQPVFEYIFVRNDNGEEVRSEKYLMDTVLYKYQSVEQTNADKTKAKITDYAVTSVEGEDFTQQTFQGAKLIIVVYDVSKASADNVADLRQLTKNLEGKIEVMALTASSSEQFENFRHEHQLAFPYYYADGTVLKTIVRSNPGLTLWVDGTVKGMWHHNDTPSASEVLELIK